MMFDDYDRSSKEFGLTEKIMEAVEGVVDLHGDRHPKLWVGVYEILRDSAGYPASAFLVMCDGATLAACTSLEAAAAIYIHNAREPKELPVIREAMKHHNGTFQDGKHWTILTVPLNHAD